MFFPKICQRSIESEKRRINATRMSKRNNITKINIVGLHCKPDTGQFPISNPPTFQQLGTCQFLELSSRHFWMRISRTIYSLNSQLLMGHSNEKDNKDLYLSCAWDFFWNLWVITTLELSQTKLATSIIVFNPCPFSLSQEDNYLLLFVVIVYLPLFLIGGAFCSLSLEPPL